MTRSDELYLIGYALLLGGILSIALDSFGIGIGIAISTAVGIVDHYILKCRERRSGNDS